MSAALRAALDRLKPGEREALVTRWGRNADYWRDSPSALGPMWDALTAIARDVDRLERARHAAGGDVPHAMRQAKTAKK